MARGRPWYKQYPERFIMGTRGLSLEERGAYREIVDYLNLRDHALPDDIKVVASLLGCTPHKWRKIRSVLIKAKKLEVHGDYITNPRFEREKAERELFRAEAIEHGREGGKRSAELRAQNELDFDHDPQFSADETQGYPQAPNSPVRARAQGEPEFEKKSQKKCEKKRKKNDDHEKSITPVSQKSATQGQGYPQPTRTRARGIEDKSLDSPLNSSPTNSREVDDRMSLLLTVCETAGFHPTSPGVIDRSLRQVEAWMKLGVDFEEVVLPTIRSIIASDPEPTRTLGRFTKHIAHEHARRNAKAATGKRYSPPASPILQRQDEEPEMAQLRTVLCQVTGAKLFSTYFNPIHMERIDEQTLRLSPDWLARTVLESDNGPMIRSVLKRQGFREVRT